MRFTDQIGNFIQFQNKTQRIVSLVPSQTELLYDLGLEDKVVGITKFCVHPPHWKKTKTIIGGTKQIKLDVISQLQPDLIIANKEENIKEQVELLAKQFPVYTSDVFDLTSAYNMMLQLGEITETLPKAQQLVAEIKENFTHLPKAAYPPLKVAYLIWRSPYMSVGSDTFIHHLLHYINCKNVFEHRHRYPTTSLDELKTLQPDVILLSSEPYPFQAKHILEMQQQLPASKCLLVDGEMFSWYGSRLLHCAAYLKQLTHQIQQLLY